MSLERETVIFVSTYRYPEGDAGAVRQHALALLAQDCGYEPLIVALGPPGVASRRSHEGMTYVSLRSPSNFVGARLWGRMAFAHRLRPWVLGVESVSAIVVVDVPSAARRFLARECRRRGVPLVHDSVEWYSASQFSWGRLHPAYISRGLLNRWVVRVGCRVIAISSYLRDHFEAKGVEVVRIPAILDVGSIPVGERDVGGEVRFVYAGSPGRKDRLGEFCQAVAEVLNDGGCIGIDLVGLVIGDLIDLGVDHATLTRLEGILTCHGRVGREEALRLLTRADFSVLFRDPSERYARAGFPTKVVESLACGTPVLLNLSSDLGDYIVEGREAIVCSGFDVSDVKLGLKRAIAMSPDSLGRMRTAARSRAWESFDYRSYRQEFLGLVEGGHRD